MYLFSLLTLSYNCFHAEQTLHFFFFLCAVRKASTDKSTATSDFVT